MNTISGDSGRNADRTLWITATGVWLLIFVQLLYSNFTALDLRLGDTDDAMRLVELRTYLAGAGWFDMNLPRVSPPDGLLSHWSRLIDAGMAGIFHFFSLFVTAGDAEKLTRAVWPVLWIAPTMAGTIAIAIRIGGRIAAWPVLVFSVLATPGHVLFTPGRIDHHNVQIALAVLSIAAALWVGKNRYAPYAAGFLVAAMLAIGLENIPLTVMTGLIVVGHFILYEKTGNDLAKFGLSMALFVVLAFVVSVPPARWLVTYCDVIAINFAVPMFIGGLGLGMVGLFLANRASILLKVLTIAGVGVIAFGFFYMLDPACIKGPFAHIDPRIRPIWLDHVSEAVSVFTTLDRRGISALAVVCFPALATVSAIAVSIFSRQGKSFAFWSYFLTLLVSCIIMFSVIRTYPYAIWLAMPVVAVAVSLIWKRFKIENPFLRICTAVAFSPLVVVLLFVLITKAAGLSKPSASAAATQDACLETASYSSLARLPTGLVAAAINLGPAIIANTPHSVLAAPYHRLSSGITDSYAIFTSPPAKAARLTAVRKVDYIVFCKTSRPGGSQSTFASNALWNDLKNGKSPAWLELVKATSNDAFQVYKVKF